MLAALMNLGFAGSEAAAGAAAPMTAVAPMARTSPDAWGTRWRTTAWLRLRPAGAS